MAEKSSLNINPITEGILRTEIIKFFIPLACGSLVQQFYNMVDAIVVGHVVGKAALASVGGSPAIIATIVTYIIVGLSNGAAVVVSHHYGADLLKNVDKAMHTAMLFSLLLGIGICVIGQVFGTFMLRLMNTPAEIVDMTSTYVRIYFVGIIPTAVYNMGSSIQRAIGDSRKPFIYLIVCNVVNIGLDILFICLFHWGIEGAAIATVIAQTVSGLLVCKALAKDYSNIHLSMNRLRIDRKSLKAELKIGTPSAMMSVVYGITNVLIQSDINVLGTDTVAAWAAYGKADILFWSCNSAMGIVASTFVAQNYGAGHKQRVLDSVKITLVATFIICGSIMVALYLFCGFFLGLFTSDGDVIRIGTAMIQFLAPTYFIYIFIEILTGALRGLGDVKIPTGATLVSLFAIRIPWLLLYFPIHRSLRVMMLSYPLQWLFWRHS